MYRQAKDALRKHYRQKRDSLSNEDLTQFNRLLLKRFKEFPFQNKHFIHFFLSIEKFNEPDTYPMIHWLKSTHPELDIVISRSNIDTHLMENFLWEGPESLQTSKWGIDEPAIGKKVLSQQLDAVIVPLLAYDLSGNRVGYGKGFYDRFLQDCRPDCQKIGLSFYDPVEQIIDVGEHDVKLDFCISPGKCWEF